jgi:hypothetical protein
LDVLTADIVLYDIAAQGIELTDRLDAGVSIFGGDTGEVYIIAL